MKKILCILLLELALPAAASATTGVTRATITNLQISKDYGNTFVFIQVSPAPTGATACASGGWSYTLPFSETGASQLYAMLLTAYSQGSPVNINGTGACSEVGFVESLDTLQLTQ